MMMHLVSRFSFRFPELCLVVVLLSRFAFFLCPSQIMDYAVAINVLIMFIETLVLVQFSVTDYSVDVMFTVISTSFPLYLW